MSTYVCQYCGKEFEAPRPRRGRPRQQCDDCKRLRHRESEQGYRRKQDLHHGRWSRWAQHVVEARRAESALHHYRGSKDRATFVWTIARHGDAMVSEIRGQMTYAPAQLLGRLK